LAIVLALAVSPWTVQGRDGPTLLVSQRESTFWSIDQYKLHVQLRLRNDRYS